MSSINAEMVVNKLLALCFNNRHVANPLDLTDVINQASDFMESFKAETKGDDKAILNFISRINSSANPPSKLKLIDELKMFVNDYRDWDEYADTYLFSSELTAEQKQLQLINDLVDFQNLLIIPNITAILNKAKVEIGSYATLSEIS